MQSQILEQESGRARIRVDVPQSDVKQAYSRVYSAVARQMRVPGFRPGKAPKGVIEKRVGKETLAQEVKDALIQTYYPRAVEALALQPVGQQIDAKDPNENEAYSFEAELELYPEFTLPDLEQIIIDTEEDPITDEMVADAVANLRRQNATMLPVERSIEANDYLIVETRNEDGSEGSSIPVDLENVAEALAQQFLGKSIGDEIELTLHEGDEEDGDADGEAAAEPEVSANESSAEEDDEPAHLKVVVRDVKEKELPETDDEFAKTLGFDTWQDVEAEIRTTLEAQNANSAFTQQQEEFTEKLLLETQVAVPQSLKERRKKQLLDNMLRDLARRNLTLETFYASLEEEEGGRDKFEQELEDNATKGVKQDLILEKLLEQHPAEVSEDELNGALAYMAQRQQKSAKDLRKELGAQGVANYRFLLMRDKALRETVQARLRAQRGESGPTETHESAPEATSAGE